MSDGVEHGLKDFLARPRMLAAFDWATTSPQGANLYSVPLPDGVLTDRIFASKVAGFAYMRSTVVVRMMINTQRFQAGRLLLTWMPLAGQNMTKYHDTKFLQYYTQRPRVEFDVSTDTEVVFKIPYVHYALGFGLSDGRFSAGILDAIVYSPLTSGTVKANMYYSFEDVELFHANEPGPFIAQSSLRDKGMSSKRSRMDPGDIEQSAMGVQPVSSMLTSIATTAQLGTEIPLISSVAGPVSWAASLAARAAHAFGYAKPLALAPRIRTYEQSDTHRINCDGAHMAVNLGLFEDNKVSHLPGFAGSDLDEMSMQYICGTYSFYAAYPWTTSDAERTALISNFACRAALDNPSPRTLTVAGSTETVLDLAPFSYLSRLFNAYRGSLKFKFKVVKTEFHSGRLRFEYRLNGALTGSNNISAYSSNVHSTIFDLRESTEFEVVVPFAAPLPYLKVSDTYARFNLAVETPLQAIGDVSASVSIIMEIAAHDDFELAMPTQVPFVPTTTAFTQIGAQSSLPRAKDPAIETNTDAQPIGGATVVGDRDANAELCIGEKILSLRQLVKRMTRCMKLVQKQTTLLPGTWSTINPFRFSPFSMVLPSSLKPTNYTDPNASTIWWQPDYITYLGCMYAMCRGSMRLAYREDGPLAVTFEGTVVPSWKQLTTREVGYNQETLVTLRYNGSPFGSPGNYVSDGGTTFDTHYEDLHVPVYSMSHSFASPVGPWLVGDQTTPVNNPGPTTVNIPPLTVEMSGGISEPGVKAYSAYRWVYRGAGEDFSLGYFTGTYPLAPANSRTVA